VVLAAGPNAYSNGLDVVLEGEAVQVRDREKLADLAEAWVAKYVGNGDSTLRPAAFDTAAARGSQTSFGSSRERRSRSARDRYSQTAFRFD
jgi:hypothetical protein